MAASLIGALRWPLRDPGSEWEVLHVAQTHHRPPVPRWSRHSHVVLGMRRHLPPSRHQVPRPCCPSCPCCPQVVLFAVPGAFTPTCSKSHLPGFVESAGALAAKGVDRVVCLSVNDAFVMDAWGAAQGVADKVLMCADGSAELTKVSGLGAGARVASAAPGRRSTPLNRPCPPIVPAAPLSRRPAGHGHGRGPQRLRHGRQEQALRGGDRGRRGARAPTAAVPAGCCCRRSPALASTRPAAGPLQIKALNVEPSPGGLTCSSAKSVLDGLL